MRVIDCGEWGIAGEPLDEDVTGALLAPVSFAAVVADLCSVLKISEPLDVERALSGTGSTQTSSLGGTGRNARVGFGRGGLHLLAGLISRHFGLAMEQELKKAR